MYNPLFFRLRKNKTDNEQVIAYFNITDLIYVTFDKDDDAAVFQKEESA